MLVAGGSAGLAGPTGLAGLSGSGPAGLSGSGPAGLSGSGPAGLAGLLVSKANAPVRVAMGATLTGAVL